MRLVFKTEEIWMFKRTDRPTDLITNMVQSTRLLLLHILSSYKPFRLAQTHNTLLTLWEVGTKRPVNMWGKTRRKSLARSRCVCLSCCRMSNAFLK